MNAFWAFTKKEFTEYYRSAKIMILGIVFLLFGMMNPVMAKFTPEILKAAGIDMQLPDPTALDSWAQFFKNVSQMGIIIVIIVFSGIMAAELSKGTLINILTKGLKRRTVILSKFLVASILWTLSYLFCFAVTYVYTAYFWSMTGMHEAFWAFSGPWLYGELLIALLILGGILFKNVVGSLLLVGGTSFVLMILSIFPDVRNFNPISLSGDNLAVLMGTTSISEVYPAFLICTALIVAVIGSSIVLFDRRSV